ncbi:glycosyltransferase family 1 protein [Pseudomonas sp. PS01300]|uniref:glycosyltransferase family 4 protein n=1 Tax=Pseudomonas sp. PS01300 TaxID=2991436 RepID=UPI00249AEFE7|nr:glycosyltransferase family 1 protein [Pseudomonas sp. PS01300]
MKLLLNTESLVPPLTGIGNYTYHLIEQLLKQNIETIQCFHGSHFNAAQQSLTECMAASIDYNLNTSNQQATQARNVRTLLRDFAFAYRARELWRNTQLRMQARRFRSFVYHEPNFILKAHSGPSVATIHDLSFLHYPQFHPRKRVEWLTTQLPKTLARADFLITDSDVVRDELISDFGVAADRVSTVYLGASDTFRPHSTNQTNATLAHYDLHHGQYVLFVGTLEPRKGVDVLIEAWYRLPETLRQNYPLVLAGAPGWQNETLKARIATLAANHGLRHLSFVPASELPALYAGAGVFVYPSLYEGFGLPVLEAMKSNAPVICTSDTSMAEFAGNGVWRVDKGDIEHLSNELQYLLESPDERYALANRGLARAGEFSWQRCARETMAIYRTVSPDCVSLV